MIIWRHWVQEEENENAATKKALIDFIIKEYNSSYTEWIIEVLLKLLIY